MGTWRGVVGLLAVLVALFPPALAQSDTEPPVLINFDFSPQSVDVTNGPVTVTGLISATDDASGVTDVDCWFFAPSSGDSARTGCGLLSGTVNDGVWSCPVTIPQYVEGGTWEVSIDFSDNVGHRVSFSADELELLGYPTTLEVTSVQDTEPPVLVDFDFGPQSVDVTNDPATVTCLISATDDASGVSDVDCWFFAPSSGDSARTGCGLLSGTVNDGVWSCPVTIPQYVEGGTWEVSIDFSDNVAGHGVGYSAEELGLLGYPTTLEVTSVQDTEPPALVDFDFGPQNVDVTNDPATVTCLISATDDASGVSDVDCLFFAPSSGSFARTGCGLLSGTVNDGVWSCPVTIPRYVEEGTWEVSIDFSDNVAGHGVGYSAEELGLLGYPTTLEVGFVPGTPTASIASPKDGQLVRGNSVTVRARLAQGNPVDVSPTLGVVFEYRVIPFGEFAPIPARNPNHPNPDTNYPYFIHWDVSGVPDGDYELRAVAHDIAGGSDPAPETIMITIDHAGPPDVEEFVNAEGLQENQTAVDSAAENKIVSGDHTVASTATDLTLPPGSLLYTTDTAKLVYPDPADEEGQLEQPEQSIGAFVDLSLISGQTDLEAGMTGDLNISYADANHDGVVDGTSIREGDLELRHLDTGTNSYVVVPSIVLVEHNMVHADPGFLGKFALAGPLMPRMWVEADKATLTWEAVSTATSYVVYRGLLSNLVDADADGLPDAGYGDCVTHLDGDPTDLLFVDPDDPGGGEGYFYLVGFVGPDGTAGLGNTSAGTRREPSVACP